MPEYCILSIQTWLFGMKYIKSVINSSQSTFCCSIKCANTIEWSFIAVYIVLVICFSVYLEMTIAYGYYTLLSNIWLGWIVISTIVTFYGIWMLIKVVNELKSKNALLKFNNW